MQKRGSGYSTSSFYILAVLEFYGFGCSGEGGEGCCGIAEIEHLRIAVVLIIHSPQIGIRVQHGFPGFYPIIFNQFAEMGNYMWHYHVTGNAIAEAFEQIKGEGDQLFGAIFTSGSAGTEVS